MLSDPSSLDELLRQIPLFASAADIETTPLADVVSLNNAPFRVVAEGQTYFLRVAADTAHHLGIRRDEEEEAARAAADAGVAPPVLYFDARGNMVLPFIAGRAWTPDEFQDEANFARLAETLARLRTVPLARSAASVYRRVERLIESAGGLGVALPDDLERFLKAMYALEAARRSDPRALPRLSHNDLWANNFIDDGVRLWLLDWEFAGPGDGLYDIATVALTGRYDEAQQRRLLAACGYAEPEDFETLQAVKRVARLFEATWALALHGLRGSGGFDYAGYAEESFAWMRASLAGS